MKKLLLWVLILVLCISLVVIFSLGGCRIVEEPIVEEVTGEPGEEAVAEEKESIEEEIEGEPPVAQISATQTTVTTVKIGESITFSAAYSADMDENINSYEWDFGDGGTASGKTVTHTYHDKEGIYKVKLTVTDNNGLSDTDTILVTVWAGETVKIKATSSTWRKGEEPYDIYSATKDNLEIAGFEVVSEESASYDATLFIDYEEKMGSWYTGDTESCRGTEIKCALKLYDKADNLLFEKEISTSTDYVVNFLGDELKFGTLYRNAINNFENSVYFKHLGVFILIKLGVGDEVSMLVFSLGNKNSDVRRSAAEALKEIGEPAIEPLIEALKDKDSDVQSGAAYALGYIGDSAIEPLISALKDKDSDVRYYAAEALGKSEKLRAVEPLIEALEDEEGFVRWRAALALGEIGDNRAIEPLNEALKDEDERVREAAEWALEEINAKALQW